MTKYNPFKANSNVNSVPEKEKPRDPLDVQELLTSSSNKAVITADGELKMMNTNVPAVKPQIELMKERYWGTEKAHKKSLQERIAWETRAMREKFPNFEIRQAEQVIQRHGWTIAQPGEIFWTGNITTYSRSTYNVAIVYPKDYPFSSIRAYVMQPYIPTSDHRFKDGQLCLYQHDGKTASYDSTTTAVTVVGWTAAWLHAYEIWQKTGNWPMLTK